MNKKNTGVKFTPQEFRLLNKCLTCGKMCDIKPETRCSECIAKNFKNCEICDIIMREGINKFYSYDTKEYNRDNDIDFKVSKNSVSEYVTEEVYEKLKSETLCNNCINWESRMKDVCFMCNNDFYNNKENYKSNGNMCEECAWLFSLKVDYSTRKYD